MSKHIQKKLVEIANNATANNTEPACFHTVLGALSLAFQIGVESTKTETLPPESITVERDNEVTADALLLTGHIVPLSEVAAWTNEQCALALEWASATYVHASDNDEAEVPPKPEFINPFENQESYLDGFTVAPPTPQSSIQLDNLIAPIAAQEAESKPNT